MKFDKKEALNMAERQAETFDAADAGTFAEKHTDKAWHSDFVLLYDMVTDKQFELDRNVYVVIAGALAYVVLPVDVIPDVIPGIGFIDDIFVVGMVKKSLSGEISRYKAWKKHR